MILFIIFDIEIALLLATLILIPWSVLLFIIIVLSGLDMNELKDLWTENYK